MWMDAKGATEMKTETETETKTTDTTNTPPTPDVPKTKPESASEEAKTASRRLPGKVADILDLDDTQRVPIITYSPTEELLTLNKDFLDSANSTSAPVASLLEVRVAANKQPNKWYLVEFYLKIRECMVSKQSVFHKRWRGVCAGATGRFLSIIGATTDFCGSLGRLDWEKDPTREIVGYRDFYAFDAKSTSAHVEYLKNGQAAALWITIAPERFDGSGGGGFPEAKALHYFEWAFRDPPWKRLLHHLARSPSLQLRAPAISPSDENYQIYPDGRRPVDVHVPKTTVRFDVAEGDYFVHFMPLLMETFGPDGRRAHRLWTKERRNDNLPVILVWQDMYVWFIWRNGPEGPLEMQYTGFWLPQIPPGKPNYERERKLRIESEKKLNMPPYGQWQWQYGSHEKMVKSYDKFHGPGGSSSTDNPRKKSKPLSGLAQMEAARILGDSEMSSKEKHWKKSKRRPMPRKEPESFF